MRHEKAELPKEKVKVFFVVEVLFASLPESFLFLFAKGMEEKPGFQVCFFFCLFFFFLAVEDRKVREMANSAFTTHAQCMVFVSVHLTFFFSFCPPDQVRNQALSSQGSGSGGCTVHPSRFLSSSFFISSCLLTFFRDSDLDGSWRCAEGAGRGGHAQKIDGNRRKGGEGVFPHPHLLLWYGVFFLCYLFFCCSTIGCEKILPVRVSATEQHTFIFILFYLLILFSSSQTAKSTSFTTTPSSPTILASPSMTTAAKLGRPRSARAAPRPPARRRHRLLCRPRHCPRRGDHRRLWRVRKPRFLRGALQRTRSGVGGKSGRVVRVKETKGRQCVFERSAFFIFFIFSIFHQGESFSSLSSGAAWATITLPPPCRPFNLFCSFFAFLFVSRPLDAWALWRRGPFSPATCSFSSRASSLQQIFAIALRFIFFFFVFVSSFLLLFFLQSCRHLARVVSNDAIWQSRLSSDSLSWQPYSPLVAPGSPLPASASSWRALYLSMARQARARRISFSPTVGGNRASPSPRSRCRALFLVRHLQVRPVLFSGPALLRGPGALCLALCRVGVIREAPSARRRDGGLAVDGGHPVGDGLGTVGIHQPHERVRRVLSDGRQSGSAARPEESDREGRTSLLVSQRQIRGRKRPVAASPEGERFAFCFCVGDGGAEITRTVLPDQLPPECPPPHDDDDDNDDDGGAAAKKK